jgi:hypothetical protein
MTMNLDELRDAHAKRLGYEQSPRNKKYWCDGRRCDAEWMEVHPVPDTLDAIAGLMPSGWVWTRTNGCWHAYPHAGSSFRVSVLDTGDELTDRARLAWLAWEAEAKGAK